MVPGEAPQNQGKVAVAVSPTLSGQGIEAMASVPVRVRWLKPSNIGGNTESMHFVLSGMKCVFYFPEKPPMRPSPAKMGGTAVVMKHIVPVHGDGVFFAWKLFNRAN